MGVRTARPVPGQVVPDLDLGLGDAAALLEPHRVEAPPQEPPALPHLEGGRDWALDVDLELELNAEVVSRGNARTLYWTMPQQLAHATSNGARLRTGDLMATGTISGSERGSEGSLIELTRNGAEPSPGGGSERAFLEDGDEVVLRGGARARSSSARCAGACSPRARRTERRPCEYRAMPAYRFLDLSIQRVYDTIGDVLGYGHWWTDFVIRATGDEGLARAGESRTSSSSRRTSRTRSTSGSR